MLFFSVMKIGFVMNALAVLWVLCAVLLILLILIQKGKGGGLSGAFGGGGMASGILGSKTGDFLTWVTIVLVSVFLLLSVVLAKFYKPTSSTVGEVSPPAAVQTELPAEQDVNLPVK